MIHDPSLFKEYIQRNKPYVGGSTRTENFSPDAEKIYKLSSNENPLGPSPKAVAAIRRQLLQLQEYHFQEDRIFTEKLHHHFHQALAPDQFLPANGGMELIDLVCRAFLGQGTNCILSSPTFMAYKNFAELTGATALDVPLREDDFSLDVEGILNAVDENTRLIFVCNPNNPTGSLFPETDVRSLIDQLPGHVVVLYDEAYHHFVNAPRYVRALDFIEAGQNVIGLHSFSKAYGLAGIRLGYIFSTPAIAEYIRHLKRPFMVGPLAMEAGMAALDDTEHVQKTIRLTEHEKQWLYKRLQEAGIFYWESEANFILIRPPYDAAHFVKDMLAQGIMIRTTDVMGAPGLVRISIGTRTMNEAFIRTLEKQFRRSEASC